MPVKILLADKSITIQKVVEMLFSGKDYEVSCVSDGETGLGEVSRVAPDVVLADVDLPRIDGYTFSARLKRFPSAAQTPVILMMSRDDVFDEAKARQASIVDHIAKPFESQELISKVKKAVGAAARSGQAQSAAGKTEPPQAPSRQAIAKAASGATATLQKPGSRQQAPTDIFDIIKEAPTGADVTHAGRKHHEDVYEVEPVVEVEEPLEHDAGKALPVGKRAVEEMREGLGLKSREQEPDIPSFESFAPPESPQEFAPRPEQHGRAEVPVVEREAREYVPPPPQPDFSEPEAAPVDARLRSIAEEIVSRIARDHFRNMPAPRLPQVSEGTVRSAVEESVSKIVRETAREVLEKVAWEVIPDLAAMLIREEIERLKAET